MLCPVCKVDLVVSERNDVEIDYCPNCRGVWLDRGELEKIIERSNAQFDNDVPQDARKRKNDYPDGELPYDYDRDDYKDRRYESGHHGNDYKDRRYESGHHGNDARNPRRRRSFLDDVFDIFG